MRVALLYLTSCLCLLTSLMGKDLAQAMSEDPSGYFLRVEDCKTRVSLASVKLTVSDLIAEDGHLVGEYTIRVPLMESKNDHGRIILPISINLDKLGKTGGTLHGKAISHKEGKTPNKIVCEVIPKDAQTILLAITTDNRTLNFKSSYEVIEAKKDS